MHFTPGQHNKDITSGQIRKNDANQLNDTPYADDMVSIDTDHGNAAIDLSGESIQESGRPTGAGRVEGRHDIFDDLNQLASNSTSKKRKAIPKKDTDVKHTV